MSQVRNVEAVTHEEERFLEVLGAQRQRRVLNDRPIAVAPVTAGDDAQALYSHLAQASGTPPDKKFKIKNLDA